MPGNVIGCAASTWTGSSLRHWTVAFRRAFFHTVAGDTEDPLKFFGLAFRASQLYLLFFVHYKKFKTFIAF